MRLRRDFIKIPLAAFVAAALSLPALADPVTPLNVSYDPTRELYAEFKPAFAKYWKAKTGQDVTIKQSHGGSGKQARSIIDGRTPTWRPWPCDSRSRRTRPIRRSS